MQAQVAARAADIAHGALQARNKAGGALDSTTMAAFIAAVDEMSNGGNRGETLLREVIAQAPKFSPAYSLMAMKLGPTPGQSVPDLLNTKRALAHRALELDPHNGEAYLLLANTSPMGAWAQREELLSKGAAADPNFAPVFRFRSKLLSQVGRFGDALDDAQKAAGLNNMFVGGGADPCFRLTNLGRLEEARPICERADRLWPHEYYNDFSQFFLDLENGREAHALARLQNPALRRDPTSDPTAWTAFLTARAAGNAAGAHAAALAAGMSADAGKVDRRVAFMQLAMTGQVDAALAQARAYYTHERLQELASRDFGDSTLLFVAATAPARQDPRFMALAAQMGLADYWRISGKWPDFCGKPGLPYDCRAEAQRLAAARP
jgi:tetratricopeptide (TPR) repeat protein